MQTHVSFSGVLSALLILPALSLSTQQSLQQFSERGTDQTAQRELNIRVSEEALRQLTQTAQIEERPTGIPIHLTQMGEMASATVYSILGSNIISHSEDPFIARCAPSLSISQQDPNSGRCP